MIRNALTNVPRTYLGLGKLIESLRAMQGWVALPDREQIEVLVAVRYFQLEALDSLKQFESNDYLRIALERRSDFTAGFQDWIAAPRGLLALTALRTLLAQVLAKGPLEFALGVGQSTTRIEKNSRPFQRADPTYAGWLASSKPVPFLSVQDQLTIDALIANRLMDIGRHCVLPEFRLGHSPFFDDSDVEQLESEGYFVKEGFSSEAQTSRLREIVYDLASVEASKGKGYFYGNGNRLQRIYNLLNKSSSFVELFLERPEIYEILQRFFGGESRHTPYYLSSLHANILKSGAKAQALHVDSSVPDPLPPWKIRLNINLLLDPFTETNGATLVYPGSHKLLRKPTRHDEVGQSMRKVIAPAGSLVVWTGHLWHQSGENKDSRPRSALLACFVASYLREVAVEENYLEEMDRDLLETLPFEVKTLLGYFHGRKISG